MNIIELAVAIEAIKHALEASFEVTAAVDSAGLAAVSGPYVTELKRELASFEGALVFRLETDAADRVDADSAPD